MLYITPSKVLSITTRSTEEVMKVGLKAVVAVEDVGPDEDPVGLTEVGDSLGLEVVGHSKVEDGMDLEVVEMAVLVQEAVDVGVAAEGDHGCGHG